MPPNVNENDRMYCVCEFFVLLFNKQFELLRQSVNTEQQSNLAKRKTNPINGNISLSN